MPHAQSLETPIWKLKLWLSKVKERLEKAAKGDEEAYSRLMKVKDALEQNGKLKSAILLEE